MLFLSLFLPWKRLLRWTSPESLGWSFLSCTLIIFHENSFIIPVPPALMRFWSELPWIWDSILHQIQAWESPVGSHRMGALRDREFPLFFFCNSPKSAEESRAVIHWGGRQEKTTPMKCPGHPAQGQSQHQHRGNSRKGRTEPAPEIFLSQTHLVLINTILPSYIHYFWW